MTLRAYFARSWLIALSQPGYEEMAVIRSKSLTFTRKVGLVTRAAPAFSRVVEEFIRRLRGTRFV